LIYLTHDDLVEMVLSGERFIVRDAATSEDVTRTILDVSH
jgi:polyhydroxyalkanoate synthesis regulator protein